MEKIKLDALESTARRLAKGSKPNSVVANLAAEWTLLAKRAKADHYTSCNVCKAAGRVQ